MRESLREQALNLLEQPIDKNQKFGVDKVNHRLDVHFDTNSLLAWLNFYYAVHVSGAPLKTEIGGSQDTCANGSLHY